MINELVLFGLGAILSLATTMLILGVLWKQGLYTLLSFMLGIAFLFILFNTNVVVGYPKFFSYSFIYSVVMVFLALSTTFVIAIEER